MKGLNFETLNGGSENGNLRFDVDKSVILCIFQVDCKAARPQSHWWPHLETPLSLRPTQLFPRSQYIK